MMGDLDALAKAYQTSKPGGGSTLYRRLYSACAAVKFLDWTRRRRPKSICPRRIRTSTGWSLIRSSLSVSRLRETTLSRYQTRVRTANSHRTGRDFDRQGSMAMTWLVVVKQATICRTALIPDNCLKTTSVEMEAKEEIGTRIRQELC